MNEAQRLAEEAKRLTETRPCVKHTVLCFVECEGCARVREAHAIIDRLAALHADQARDARIQALEEAAKLCEDGWHLLTRHECAEAIRSLAQATKPVPGGKELP